MNSKEDIMGMVATESAEAASGSRPAPCSVGHSPRHLIHMKLLAALDNDEKVAILASKQDLEDMIAALYGYELGERKGDVLSWEAHMNRRKELADCMIQLLREAFPLNSD